jgi:hypothetical protein
MHLGEVETYYLSEVDTDYLGEVGSRRRALSPGRRTF